MLQARSRPKLVSRSIEFARALCKKSGLPELQYRFNSYKVPGFFAAFWPLLLLSTLLFTRSPMTNFIFDEQEALLANPYINNVHELGFWDAFRRDFWGLPPDRSVGSYRPIPNLLWRTIAAATFEGHALVGRFISLSRGPELNAWLFHIVNIVLHAINGALLVTLVGWVTQRPWLAWLSGSIFTASAILTEAVSGVVGIADVLSGLGALLALVALRLPPLPMTLAVSSATLFGLFSKESALVCVPLIPLAALGLAPNLHPHRPQRIIRFTMAALGSVTAFWLYVSLRKLWFPAPIARELLEPLPTNAGFAPQAMRSFMLWFQQPSLPRDAMNNPLVLADFPHRVAGALRVYARGLGQVVMPLRLSGDYSFPQEPIPGRLVFVESVLGGLAMIVAPLAASIIWLRSLYIERLQRASLGIWATAPAALLPWKRSTRPLLALALLWLTISYFPHSNIPTLLPTIRAERFWYFPAMGTSVLLAFVFVWLWEKTQRFRRGLPAILLFAAFFTFQCVKARAHAFDYTDDLAFWTATRKAVPRSAKAHLNYSVMWGARGRLDTRLEANGIALELAPDWPMANIYLGDTLCRLHRPEEAFAHYRRGFELAPNESNLIALALQCLWDEGAIETHREELTRLAEEHRESWLSYLVTDILHNGEEHGGVEPRYRPRGYNEGPRK